MKLNGVPSRTIWLEPDGWSVGIIDQTLLPHKLERPTLKAVEDAARAIKSMQVRGAPLIGVTAAYGVALAMRADASDSSLERAVAFLGEQRPTAVNLRWALEDLGSTLKPLAPSVRAATAYARAAELAEDPPRRDNLRWALEDLRSTLKPLAPSVRAAAAYARAAELAEEDVETCRKIGVNGMKLIQDIAAGKGGRPVNVLTHCNAGWLACVDWGTATSPIYQAHNAGVPLHVWVDETRPRNQGAALTAFELLQHGVPHSLIADNAGGHFMQQGEVDLVIVGTDRVTANGDVANKIGTYLKALAAFDTHVPFYVALPFSTIDWRTEKGSDIPIEERSEDEVLRVQGRLASGDVSSVLIAAEGTHARNPAFDVTPARLVTGFITERGICAASREGLHSLYPERSSAAA